MTDEKNGVSYNSTSAILFETYTDFLLINIKVSKINTKHEWWL